MGAGYIRVLYALPELNAVVKNSRIASIGA
jgi:hypothetical protein